MLWIVGLGLLYLTGLALVLLFFAGAAKLNQRDGSNRASFRSGRDRHNAA